MTRPFIAPAWRELVLWDADGTYVAAVEGYPFEPHETQSWRIVNGRVVFGYFLADTELAAYEACGEPSVRYFKRAHGYHPLHHRVHYDEITR